MTELLSLYAVGSYALGIHEPGADLDCVCVGAMDREEFFHTACAVLGSQGVKVVRVSS
jgi:poly(A) polymerase Pap1